MSGHLSNIDEIRLITYIELEATLEYAIVDLKPPRNFGLETNSAAAASRIIRICSRNALEKNIISVRSLAGGLGRL